MKREGILHRSRDCRQSLKTEGVFVFEFINRTKVASYGYLLGCILLILNIDLYNM